MIRRCRVSRRRPSSYNRITSHRKAIQVINISGNQVGHLPRACVNKLAPLIDARRVFVEGKINDGNMTGAGTGTQYSISM